MIRSCSLSLSFHSLSSSLPLIFIHVSFNRFLEFDSHFCCLVDHRNWSAHPPSAWSAEHTPFAGVESSFSIVCNYVNLLTFSQINGTQMRQYIYPLLYTTITKKQQLVMYSESSTDEQLASPYLI